MQMSNELTNVPQGPHEKARQRSLTSSASFAMGLPLGNFILGGDMKETHTTDQDIFLRKLGIVTLAACGVILFLGMILFSCSTRAYAEEVIDGYSISQYVKAIYKAEGGKRAKYAYGIRSVPYKDVSEAKRICYNTVRNNIKRYKAYGYRKHPRFIQFLGSRYCPTKGANLTGSEKRLNIYWQGNVMKFLKAGA